jgi:hypothetical protein
MRVMYLHEHKEVLQDGHDTSGGEGAVSRENMQRDASEDERGGEVVEERAHAVEQLHSVRANAGPSPPL